jgi:hypothetical protein
MNVDHKLAEFGYKLSWLVARSIEVVRGDCWGNAWKAVTSCQALVDAQYVEGWLALAGEPEVYLHGWVEKDNRIIDPTHPKGPFPGKFAYFPVLRFTVRQVREMTEETDPTKFLPLHLCFDALKTAEFKKAHDEAVEWRWRQE